MAKGMYIHIPRVNFLSLGSKLHIMCQQMIKLEKQYIIWRKFCIKKNMIFNA
jgi:hypothetical protein